MQAQKSQGGTRQKGAKEETWVWRRWGRWGSLSVSAFLCFDKCYVISLDWGVCCLSSLDVFSSLYSRTSSPKKRQKTKGSQRERNPRKKKRRSGSGKIMFLRNVFFPQEMTHTRLLWWITYFAFLSWVGFCCHLWWLGGRRKDILMAPNGAFSNTRVRYLLLRTNPCLTKSDFTMMVSVCLYEANVFGCIVYFFGGVYDFSISVGKPMKLSAPAEEVATFFSKMLDHEYTTKDIFRKNFFKDWRKVMT